MITTLPSFVTDVPLPDLLLLSESGGSSAAQGVLFFSGLFILVGLVMLYTNAREPLARARLYLGMESFDPAVGTDGTDPVAVSGTVGRPDETVTGPVSGEECVAYVSETQVRTTRSTGSHDHDGVVGDDDHDENRTTQWETTDSSLDSVPFRVETEHGSVAVDPNDAQLKLPVREKETASLLTRVLSLVPLATLFLGRLERRLERYVTPGDDVTVIGNVAEADDADDVVATVEDGGEAGVFEITTRSGRRLAIRSTLSLFRSSLLGMIALLIGVVVLLGAGVTGVFW